MEMDDVFFQNIKIPMKKDYERWSSDDARDSPSGYNYFSQLQNAENFSVPSAVAKKDVEELDGCQLSKISSSSSLKSQSCVDTAKGNVARQPLKPVTIAAKTTDYSDLSRLAMCNPPKPVEREAQRRRSQMKANENAHATAPVVKHPVPKRSFSAPRRDSSQTATKRDSSQTAARRDSSQAATRPIAKAATPTNRPVTRSVTGANRIAKVRKYTKLEKNVIQELASMKITPSRESRDRSQRVNVSAAGKTQPACAPTKPLSSSFCSAKKTETASTRSAVLRARSADKAARPPVAAPAKPLSRPAPVKLSTETVESRRAPRVPVRIAGATPSKKPAAVPIKTGQHATTSTVRTVRASSLPRSTAVTGTPTGSSKARDSLFNRLATPKAINHPRPPTVSTTPKPNTQPVAKLQDIASLRAASDRLRSQYTRAPAGTVGLKIVSRKTTEQ